MIGREAAMLAYDAHCGGLLGGSWDHIREWRPKPLEVTDCTPYSVLRTW